MIAQQLAAIRRHIRRECVVHTHRGVTVSARLCAPREGAVACVCVEAGEYESVSYLRADGTWVSGGWSGGQTPPGVHDDGTAFRAALARAAKRWPSVRAALARKAA